MDLKVNMHREGDVVVVAFDGEVDVYTAPTVRDAISKVLAAGHHNIVADLRDVGFLDSTGLGVLVGQMRVVITNPHVLRNFKITGLDNIFAIDTDVDSSVAAISA